MGVTGHKRDPEQHPTFVLQDIGSYRPLALTVSDYNWFIGKINNNYTKRLPYFYLFFLCGKPI